MGRTGLKIPPAALFGIAVVVMFVALAVLGPWIMPFDPETTVGKTWSGPSAEHWLGTDNIGRDSSRQRIDIVLRRSRIERNQHLIHRAEWHK